MIPTPKNIRGPPLPSALWHFLADRGGFSKVFIGFQNFAWAPNSQIIRIPTPRTMTFLGGHGGISKSWPRVPKPRIWLLRGWGRCLMVTLQTHAAENFRSCRWGAEWRVSRAQSRKRGPPSAWPDFLFVYFLYLQTQPKSQIQDSSKPNIIPGTQTVLYLYNKNKVRLFHHVKQYFRIKECCFFNTLFNHYFSL